MCGAQRLALSRSISHIGLPCTGPGPGFFFFFGNECSRDISENVLYHLGLADFLHDSGHPAWLLITDLAGAYDNVDRDYLL